MGSNIPIQSREELSNLSVVITCYNKIDFIDPIFAQLVKLKQLGAEIIMVDDGSTDGSSEALILKHNIFDFVLIRNDNQGLSGARDSGISLASRDFIFFIDIDDTPDIENLRKFFIDFCNSGAVIGQSNFFFTEKRVLGTVAINQNLPVLYRLENYRDALFNSRGWWRFIYKRDFLLLEENRFGKVFMPLKGKSFVLDDIFWLLHICSLDLEVYQSSNALSIYNYFLPEANGAQRWESYLRQIALLPKAFILYVKDLEGHRCKHDNVWLYNQMLKILWDHATQLSFASYFANSFRFYESGAKIALKIDLSSQIKNLLYFLCTPIRILRRYFKKLQTH